MDLGDEGRRRYLTLVHPQPAPPRAVTGRFVVGRRPGDRGLSVDDRRLSRAHFEVRGGRAVAALRLEDLDAKNRTRVDGTPVHRAYLADQAVVRAGDSIFVVEDQAPPELSLADAPAGRSSALDWAQQVADRVAGSPLTVLIRGPSGAGKERLARRVHDQSGRPGAFVAVNCTTLPKELVASELFGHVRGAFSGAEARTGLVAAAAGGTLFLDEVGDLPLAQQPMLLRMLQDRVVRPVGGDRETRVDVRVVGATHQDLLAAVAGQRFRADLLARLTEFEVDLPGLARRKVDVLPVFRELVGRPICADAAEALLLHDWPTNVRGLQKLAARIRLFAEDAGQVTLPMLPTKMQSYVEEEAMEVVEVPRSELERLLGEHQGNVSRVARALGLTRQRLYRRLEVLEIDVRSFR